MDIKSLFKNCLDVKVVNDIYYPARFTNKQLDFYKNYNDMLMDRSNCAAGVIIEFYTDNETISFSAKTDHFVRSFCSFDIYEDGQFKQNFSFDNYPPDVFIEYNLRNKGKTKITIYLPFSCHVGIYNYNFGNFETIIEEKPKLLCYGDSVTQCMTTEYPSFSYTALIANYFNMEHLNQGVGMFRFCADSLDEDLPYKPDIITVAYGTNDLSKFESMKEIEQDAYDYIVRLKSIFQSADIYIISPIWRQTRIDDPEKYKDFITYNKSLETISSELSVNYINGLTLVPNIADFFVDGLHPNSKGFLCYSFNLTKHIKPRFNK